MAIQAAHRAIEQAWLNGSVTTHLAELLRASMALQTVLIVISSSESDCLGVGARRVPGEMTIAVHFGSERSGQAVVLVARIALIRRNPFIPIVTGRQRHAL